MWSLMGFSSPDDEENPDKDTVLWEETPNPFVLPSAWSNHWERQQRAFLKMSHAIYQQNVETNRRIMLTCLDSVRVPYV